MNKLVSLLIAVLGVSCMQEDPEIGSDFFDEVSFEIVSWDTLTVDMYTVRFDSIKTNNPSRLLVGEAENVELGPVQAEAYFQVGPDLDYQVDELKDAAFKDAFLTLYYDSYYYGDTTSQVRLEVFEVAEEMELDDELNLYNYSSFEIKRDDMDQPISLGSYDFGPRPFTQDSVEIPLSQAFSEGLFEYLKSDQIDASDFLDSLRGLKIQSSVTSVILGFKPESTLKLNYLDKSESVSVERTLYLTSDVAALQFNHIEAAEIDHIFPEDQEEKLSTESTDHKAYIQSGLGLGIRVELPYIRDLLSADEVPLIDEVKLELVFENEIPEEIYMLNAGIIIRRVDHNNEILFQYDESPELMLDIEFGEERKFVVDISDFVSEQLAIDTPENDHGLLIQFPEEYSQGTLNHLIVSDQDRGAESSKIILNVLNIK